MKSIRIAISSFCLLLATRAENDVNWQGLEPAEEGYEEWEEEESFPDIIRPFDSPPSEPAQKSRSPESAPVSQPVSDLSAANVVRSFKGYHQGAAPALVNDPIDTMAQIASKVSNMVTEARVREANRANAVNHDIVDRVSDGASVVDKMTRSMVNSNWVMINHLLDTNFKWFQLATFVNDRIVNAATETLSSSADRFFDAATIDGQLPDILKAFGPNSHPSTHFPGTN